MWFGKTLISAFLYLAVHGLILAQEDTCTFRTKSSYHSKSNSSENKLSSQIHSFENLIRDIELGNTQNQSLAPLLTQLGNLYYDSQDFPNAIKTYIRSIVIRELSLTESGISPTDLGWHMIEVGNSFYNLKDFYLAEYTYNFAFRAFSQSGNREGVMGMITSVNNIGLCRLKSGDPAGALTVFETMQSMAEKFGEKDRVYISQIYIGMCYREMHKYNKSISVLCNKNLVAMTDKNMPLNLFRLQQLGDSYYQSNQIDSAVKVFESIADLPESNDNAEILSNACSRLAVHFLKTNNLDAAQKYSLLAKKHLEFVPNLSVQISVDHVLYIINKKRGNYSEALGYYESYRDNQDKLNNIQLTKFIEDYNTKAKRISTSIEIAQIEAQRKNAETEKSNQKNLSVFMIVITMLLLVMLFTGKGFEPRIKLLEEYVSELKRSQKLAVLLVFMTYFLSFFYFFVPVEHAVEIQNFRFVFRLMPGLLAFIVFVLVLPVFTAFYARKNTEERNFKTYILFSGMLYLLVFISEYMLFSIFGFTSFNFLMSLSIIVLASFVVPFYLVLMAVERLIIKRFETMSATLTNDISHIKQKIIPVTESITILSEKTSGKISFNLDDFIAVEAQGNYCMFYIMKKDVVTRKLLHITMKALETRFEEFPQVIRCHKSFLVNIHQISKVNGNSRGYSLVFNDDIDPIPVSRGYQKDVMETIRKFTEDLS